MKILFLSIGYPPSSWHGISTYTAYMARALAAQGHEVHVLDCLPRPRPRDERDGTVLVHRRRTLRVRGLRRLQRGLPSGIARVLEQGAERWASQRFLRDRLLRRFVDAVSYYREYRRLGVDFDVLESPGGSVELLFGLFRTLPLVVHLLTPPVYDLKLEHGHLGWRASIADSLDRMSALRADLLTSGSRMMVEALRQEGWLDHREPWVIPLTVDPAPWLSLPSVENTRPVILVVARLEFRKAPEVLIEAARHLRGRVEGLKLAFVGTSSDARDGRPYRDWLAERAREIGVDCSFEDRLSHQELVERFASARVVAIPSRSESFSLVGLEAMVAGRPIVCTSRVGLSELVADSGAGTVVAPDDPGALAEALTPYLVSPSFAAQAGQRARRLAQTRLAPEAVAKQRESAYKEAIRRWKHRSGDRRRGDGPLMRGAGIQQARTKGRPGRLGER
jgi:glycogen(starch) synthase